jgi:hypothetical protein
MKHSERKHLKTNEFANAIGHVNEWRTQHQRSISLVLIAVAVVVVAILGYTAWQNSVDTRARTLLAEAMVVYEAPVQPAAPPSLEATGTETPAAPVVPPPPGTYPSEKAKLDAALPKLLAAADEYPSTDPGQTARYHAASALVGLGRFDEAVTQYEPTRTNSGSPSPASCDRRSTCRSEAASQPQAQSGRRLEPL